MKKFVIALCLPKGSKSINSKEVSKIIMDSLADKKGESKDVVVLDLNNTSSQAIDKFINMGGIDCFAFTPDTLLEDSSKEILKKVLKVDMDLGKNTHFLNVYNSKDEENVEKSVALGDILLKDGYHRAISHIDISQDKRILSQNLKGIKNQSLKTREMLIKKDTDVLDLTRRIVDEIEKNKDEYTANHIKSVCMIAEKIAKNMGLTGQEIETLEIGALLHDIGKEDVSDPVLKKPQRLTDEEFLEMRSHVTFGEIELNQYDLGQYERAKVIASEHHERYDGTGYPRGIKGENIDILARISCIADSAQAMFGRSYQQGKTKTQLIEELDRCRGTQFDPNIVGYLVDILEKEPESIGVSYGENGEILYEVKEVEEIIGDKENAQNTRNSKITDKKAKQEEEFIQKLQQQVNHDFSCNNDNKQFKDEPEIDKSVENKNVDDDADEPIV